MSMGQTTPQFQRWSGYGYAEEEMKARSFSIFYTDNIGNPRSLDIIAESDGDCNYAYQAVENLISETAQERTNTSPDILYIRDMWEKADDDASGKLSKYEVFSVIEMMNIHMPQQQIKKIFDVIDQDKSGELDREEFTQLIELLRHR